MSDFYRTKSNINSKIDSMIKAAIIGRKTLIMNDFLRELGSFGGGEKMIRERLETNEIDGYIRIQKHSTNSKMDKIIPSSVEE